MLWKKTVFLIMLIFSLLFSFSCGRRKTRSFGITTQKAQGTKFEILSSPKAVKVGDSFLFSVKGGTLPINFSTNFGKIDSKGFYTAPQNAGVGQVSITDSANNKITFSITVFSPLLISPSSLILVGNKNYNFSAAGGVPPYSFASKIGSMDLNTGAYTAPSTIGEEIITVSDSIGNKAISFLTINPNLEIKPTNITLTKNGSLTFSIYGGIPPYSFSANFGTINSSGVYFSPAEEGAGIVTVKDNLGNIATSNITVISGLGINPLRINLRINSSTNFTASGGYRPYVYTASRGVINSSGFYIAPSTKGSVTITVTDSSGKKQTAEVNIYEPPKISPTEITLAVGNTFKFSANEGVPPYKFSTNIGTIDSTSGFFTAPTNPGSGKVTVTDFENNTAAVNLTIEPKLLLSPATLILGINNNYSFKTSNGVPPYTYRANTGRIGENGDYTAPSTAGEDIITVTDSFGNQATAFVTINPKLEFIQSTKAMRPGEYFTFNIKGGVPPYAFSAKYGLIDQFGLYNFPEGINWDEIQITDSLGEIAAAKVLGDFGNLWTWVNGTDLINQSSNVDEVKYPGGKLGCASWTDNEGNLWLFGGGKGSEFIYNELWKYNTASNQWTWVNQNDASLNHPGSYGEFRKASKGNIPGGRYFSNYWTDNKGNFWLFGGGGYGGNSLPTIGFNDLWKFDANTGLWTWISGSKLPNQPGIYGSFRVPSQNNIPGARHSAVSWADDKGNLWLFGGFGKDSSSLKNDLWKFNISTNEWTWVSGSNLLNQQGIYGSPRVAHQNNQPGGRQNAIGWADRVGNLWLFGGYGNGSSGTGYLNDLWKFNTTTNQWTWMSGGEVPNQPGIYGKMGEGSINNIPRSRKSAVSWADISGNLWLFGGFEKFSSSVSQNYNDLWKFNPATNEWTWVSGSKSSNQFGSYGRMGVTTLKGVPGTRNDGVSWYDRVGNLWLFGGFGYGTSGTGYLNDLWKFIPK